MLHVRLPLFAKKKVLEQTTMKNLLLISLLIFGANASAKSFKLTSSSFKDGDTLIDKYVFNGWGCSGSNISPELRWTDAPKETRSFAITVFDKDAPTGSGWWHWTVANIPADITELPEGASSSKLPPGALEGRTDFGKPGYAGACPPASDKAHHYVFTVYALKTDKLMDLTNDSSGAMFGYYINQNQIAKATLTVKYSRKEKSS
jgi:Raf kinase inhibitor-like YbhB/YbcL family protein